MINMKKKFLIRLDDACPTMDRAKWNTIFQILDKYSLKPMIGVIPNNEDMTLYINTEDELFWDKVFSWQEKGWAIALHGYNHVYNTNAGGINPMWTRSEFAGNTYDIQRDKISKGLKILTSKGIIPKYFFAPSHTFDENTIKALRLESHIRIISDTISFREYRADDFMFIPQQFGRFRDPILPGVWTFCFHPNTMNESDIKEFERFVITHLKEFISFDEINFTKRKKGIWDVIFSKMYYSFIHIRNII